MAEADRGVSGGWRNTETRRHVKKGEGDHRRGADGAEEDAENSYY